MIDDIETPLRDELHASLVPFDADRADRMIRAAELARPHPVVRQWGPPIATAAVVVAAGSGVAVLATHGHGAHPTVAADGSRTADGSTAAAPSLTPSSVATVSTVAPTPDSSPSHHQVAFMLTPDAGPGSTASADGPALAPGERLVVTSVILQNPGADQGEIQIGRVHPDGSSEGLLREALSDFRDLDHDFGAEPLVFTSASEPRVTVVCDNTGQPCTSGALMVGHYERP
jgi:hypothetical protein